MGRKNANVRRRNAQRAAAAERRRTLSTQFKTRQDLDLQGRPVGWSAKGPKRRLDMGFSDQLGN